MHWRSQARCRLCGLAHIGLQTFFGDLFHQLFLHGQQFPCAIIDFILWSHTGIPAAIESLPYLDNAHAGNGTQHRLGALCK